MELYVVRHGQTEYNVKKVFQGHIDIPLNEVGEKQAKEIVLKFQNIDIDKLRSTVKPTQLQRICSKGRF